MDYYDYYKVSQDPAWHRWVDGFVILVMGVAAGLVIAQGWLLQQTTTTTTTTEIIRRAPAAPQIESGISTDAPSGIKIEES